MLLPMNLLASDLPVLPFEKYFAAINGQKELLRFDDFSGRIGSDRIKALLRSGDTIGDRVLLRNGTAVYFPEGYIVSSRFAVPAFRPKAGVAVAEIDGIEDLDPNPHYGLVERFDDLLGPICAEEQNAGGGRLLRLRRTERGVFSLVTVRPGAFEALIGRRAPSYEVISVVDEAYLPGSGVVRQLVMGCETGNQTVAEQ